VWGWAIVYFLWAVLSMEWQQWERLLCFKEFSSDNPQQFNLENLQKKIGSLNKNKKIVVADCWQNHSITTLCLFLCGDVTQLLTDNCNRIVNSVVNLVLLEQYRWHMLMILIPETCLRNLHKLFEHVSVFLHKFFLVPETCTKLNAFLFGVIFWYQKLVPDSQSCVTLMRAVKQVCCCCHCCRCYCTIMWSLVYNSLLLQALSCLRSRNRLIICRWKQTQSLLVNSCLCDVMLSSLSSTLLSDIQFVTHFWQQAIFLHTRWFVIFCRFFLLSWFIMLHVCVVFIVVDFVCITAVNKKLRAHYCNFK